MLITSPIVASAQNGYLNINNSQIKLQRLSSIKFTPTSPSRTVINQYISENQAISSTQDKKNSAQGSQFFTVITLLNDKLQYFIAYIKSYFNH